MGGFKVNVIGSWSGNLTEASSCLGYEAMACIQAGVWAPAYYLYSLAISILGVQDES